MFEKRKMVDNCKVREVNTFLCGKKKIGGFSPTRLRRSTQFFPASSRFSIETLNSSTSSHDNEFKMRDAAKLIWRKVASFIQFQPFKEPLFNGQLQQTNH